MSLFTENINVNKIIDIEKYVTIDCKLYDFEFKIKEKDIYNMLENNDQKLFDNILNLIDFKRKAGKKFYEALQILEQNFTDEFFNFYKKPEFINTSVMFCNNYKYYEINIYVKGITNIVKFISMTSPNKSVDKYDYIDIYDYNGDKYIDYKNIGFYANIPEESTVAYITLKIKKPF